ncbi:MAG: DUF4296 domain-containing protein [Paludibacteraceae bacterium]
MGKEKMTDILFEIHKTEGVLQAEGLTYNTPDEKKKHFDFILQKYGVTQVELDSSLVWYTKHPKEFGLVYADVLARIDTLTAQVQRGKFHPGNKNFGFEESNIWNLRTSYRLTKDSARTKINFEIPNTGSFFTGDKYILSFLRRVTPLDSSINPRIVLRINYLNGKKDSIYTKTFNDSLLRRYTIIFKARDSLKIESITGALLDCDRQKGNVNAYFDSIKLIRKFNVYNQSKIKQRIDLLDKTQPKAVLQTK